MPKCPPMLRRANVDVVGAQLVMSLKYCRVAGVVDLRAVLDLYQEAAGIAP